MIPKEILKNSVTKFIDVRTNTEFNAGHVNGAINIPLDQFQKRYTEIDGLGELPVVIYCRSGNRSRQATSYLIQKGFKNVYNGGGMDDITYNLN